jgi:hypothetical protein
MTREFVEFWDSLYAGGFLGKNKKTELGLAAELRVP